MDFRELDCSVWCKKKKKGRIHQTEIKLVSVTEDPILISRVVLQRYQNIGNNCAVLSIHFRIAKFPTKLAPGWTFGW